VDNHWDSLSNGQARFARPLRAVVMSSQISGEMIQQATNG
jgi:hypothetical protein